MAKLSRPVTRWLSLSSVSKRLEPMKPATPVISQVDGLVDRCFFRVLYLVVMG